MPSHAQLIAFLAPDWAESHYPQVAQAAARKLRGAGYTLLAANTESDAAVERQALELLLECRYVAGLIVASCRSEGGEAIFESLASQRLPLVLLERQLPGVRAAFVGWDDEAIGAAATEHLISRGCRHIAHLRGPCHSSGQGRFYGYAAALARAGLKVCPGYVVEAGDGSESGYRAMKQLLAASPRVDGVVCYNDAIAVGAVKAVLEAGLEIPYDLEVIGAGNLHYTDVLRVPLSTVELNAAQAGEHAARLLLRALAGGPEQEPERVLVPFEVIPRESSRAVAI
ncbi:MAG: substrate-binding domain-containing protein [Bryobacterales bacterium]|nr:substrate-binding domain-containing protein [Bryobacteraceae bacterium]MDW8131104.1 substrate-binding domain-containing protein [Bryobacterales bacterium]